MSGAINLFDESLIKPFHDLHFHSKNNDFIDDDSEDHEEHHEIRDHGSNCSSKDSFTLYEGELITNNQLVPK